MTTPRIQPGLPILAAAAGLAGFAACGLTLALLGLGLPYAAGAAISGLCAGLLIYSLGRCQPRSPAPPTVMEDTAPVRLAALEREMSNLRHELRGALSPALMVSDRLLKHEDPLVRRAGDTVVRSVDRATALINQTPPSA